jgi:putative transposase
MCQRRAPDNAWPTVDAWNRGVAERRTSILQQCVLRRDGSYPLSFRSIDETMAEREACVDHSELHRWSIRMSPVLAATLRRRRRPGGSNWRIDETDIQVAGQWQYLYGAVDRDGDAVDLLLRAKRDHAAARAFFERAMELHGVPEKITIDKSGANAAAITRTQADSGLSIVMRQSKYLSSIV